MRERIVWIVLLVIGVAGGFYAGRINGITVGQTQVQQTANRFFAERGAGTNGAGFAPGGQAPGGQGGQGGQRGFGTGQNVIGTVDKIDGSTISVTTFDGSTTTIQVNADAMIRKEATGQLSDVRVGDRIVASGAQAGNVFEATALQLGGQFGGRFQGNQAGSQ